MSATPPKPLEGSNPIASDEAQEALKQRERFRTLSLEVLKRLNAAVPFKESIHSMLELLQATMGCDAIGIRFKAGDDFPYYEHSGFSPAFILKENSLLTHDPEGNVCMHPDGNPQLECTCGLILSGRADLSSGMFTKNGSCWTNHSVDALRLSESEDPRFHPRNRCIHAGYLSIALIPIRARNATVGLLQLNTRNAGSFTEEGIEALEMVGCQIGETLLRKQMEEALRESESRALKLADEARAATHAKSSFLATMSHEIRTPMNGVLGAAELLALTDLNEHQQDLVAMLGESGKRLLAIVNDILDLSRVESGKVQINRAPLDPFACFKATLQPLRYLAEQKGLILHSYIDPEIPSPILGDSNRIAQILTNLVGNAIKFTDAGSIAVRCELTPPSGSGIALRFSVSDTGIGIPSPEIQHLCDPFFQASTPSSQHRPGTGLGLCICKKLIELMGGALAIQSEPGVGSSFSFGLEFDACQSKIVTEETKDRSALGDLHAHALIVDDDPISAKLTSHFLRQIGMSSDTVNHGSLAIDCLKNSRYDLVFMDCSLPEMDGFETTRAIRKGAGGDRCKTIPIIAQTANVMSENRDRCHACGMNEVLTKPIGLAALTHVLSSTLLKSLS